LVTEEEDLALGGVESELVQALLRELGKLDTANLSAEVGADVGYFRVLVQQVGLGGISAQAGIGVLCGRVQGRDWSLLEEFHIPKSSRGAHFSSGSQ
jgi:hypothetical protein